VLDAARGCGEWEPTRVFAVKTTFRTIRSADKEWSQSAKIGTLDKFLTFYTDDASVLPFNAPLVTGKANIRQFFTQLFSKPGSR
jgi:ketosteroid isomerase-like protein